MIADVQNFIARVQGTDEFEIIARVDGNDHDPWFRWVTSEYVPRSKIAEIGEPIMGPLKIDMGEV